MQTLPAKNFKVSIALNKQGHLFPQRLETANAVHRKQNPVSGIYSVFPLWLVVMFNANHFRLKIHIPSSQTAQLPYPHTCMQQQNRHNLITIITSQHFKHFYQSIVRNIPLPWIILRNPRHLELPAKRVFDQHILFVLHIIDDSL